MLLPTLCGRLLSNGPLVARATRVRARTVTMKATGKSAVDVNSETEALQTESARATTDSSDSHIRQAGRQVYETAAPSSQPGPNQQLGFGPMSEEYMWKDLFRKIPKPEHEKRFKKGILWHGWNMFLVVVPAGVLYLVLDYQNEKMKLCYDENIASAEREKRLQAEKDAMEAAQRMQADRAALYAQNRMDMAHRAEQAKAGVILGYDDDPAQLNDGDETYHFMILNLERRLAALEDQLTLARSATVAETRSHGGNDCNGRVSRDDDDMPLQGNTNVVGSVQVFDDDSLQTSSMVSREHWISSLQSLTRSAVNYSMEYGIYIGQTTIDMASVLLSNVSNSASSLFWPSLQQSNRHGSHQDRDNNDDNQT